MKNIKSILGLMMGLAAVGFTACDDDDYTATPMPDSDQVYFSNVGANEILLEENQSSLSIEINRIKSEAALSVPVTVSDTSSLFTVAQTANFEAGETSANVKINFDFANLVPDTPYELTLSVDGCEYGDNVKKVIIKYAPWTDWAPLGWSYPSGVSNFAQWEAVYATASSYTQIAKNGILPTYTYNAYYSGQDLQPVFYRKSQLNPTQSQILLYNWGSGINAILDWDQSTGEFSLEKTYFTNNSTYGAVHISDPVKYWHNERGETTPTYADFPSNYDRENGRFTLYIMYYVSAGYFGFGPETIQLPGYEKADYSVTVVDRGLFVTPEEELGEVFNITFGADLGSIKYAVIEDEDFTDEEKQAIVDDVIAGKIDAVKTTEQGDKIIYGEPGNYLLIICQYDNDGNYQDYTVVPFTIESLSAWQQIGTGSYTYTRVFAENGKAVVDEGLPIYQNAEDPTLFKIGNWGMGTDLKFNMTEDGVQLVENQFILEDEGTPVYISDMFSGCCLYDGEYTWSFVIQQALSKYCDGTEGTPSFYNEEEGAFYFNTVYHPEDNVYDWGFEKFQLEEVAKAPAKVCAPMLAAMNKAPRSINYTCKMMKSVKAEKKNLSIVEF